jgi:thiosulfate reductase cytochrome b subunit
MTGKLHGYQPIVRLTHWCTAIAVLLLIGSGWRIYDQDLVVTFGYFVPLWATLGGEPSHSLAINGDTGFANSLMWHFAAACLLFASLGTYLVYGLATRRFWRGWLPIKPLALVRDVEAALTLRLRHQPGATNAVQRLAYVLVLFDLLLMVATGLAMWKPVQLWWLTALMGGFQTARLAHFFGMSGLVMFIAIHAVMALTAPRNLFAMVTGRSSVRLGRIGHDPI